MGFFPKTLQGIYDSLTSFSQNQGKFSLVLAWRRKIFKKWELPARGFAVGFGFRIYLRFSLWKNKFPLPKSFEDCKEFGRGGGPGNFLVGMLGTHSP
jgi:hypothetical protein